MRKINLLRAAVLPTAAVAALGLGSSAAFAASSYDVTAGSATSADNPVSWSASTTGDAPQITFVDTDANVTLNCASGAASGTLNVGQVSGSDIATISSTAWNTCTGPLGLSFTVAGSGDWFLNATGDTDANGTTAGNISNINAHVADPGICEFDVTGSVDGSYTNGTSSGTLDLPGTTSTLTISNVTGPLCALAGLSDGHHASFKATYDVAADNASFNPIQVTSNP